MVVNGERIVSSWHAMDNTQMPRLDRGLQEVVYAPVPAAAPDRSGVCGVVACPAFRGTVGLGRTRRACGLGAGDALPLAGRVAGVSRPGVDRSAGAARG